MSDSLTGNCSTTRLQSTDPTPILLDALFKDSDEAFSNRIRDVLEHGQMPGAEVLLPLLGHADDIVRRRAVFLLSQVGGSEAIEGIMTCLGDGSQIVRASAVSSLGRLQARSALPALLALFGPGADPQLCKAAAEALSKIGDPAAIPTLQEAAKTIPGFVIRSACDMAMRRLQSLQRAAGG